MHFQICTNVVNVLLTNSILINTEGKYQLINLVTSWDWNKAWTSNSNHPAWIYCGSIQAVICSRDPTLPPIEIIVYCVITEVSDANNSVQGCALQRRVVCLEKANLWCLGLTNGGCQRELTVSWLKQFRWVFLEMKRQHTTELPFSLINRLTPQCWRSHGHIL